MIIASQETEFKEYNALIAQQEEILPQTRLVIGEIIVEDDQSYDALNHDNSFHDNDDEVIVSTKTNEHSHQSNAETANSTTTTQHIQKRYVLSAWRIHCSMLTMHFFPNKQ